VVSEARLNLTHLATLLELGGRGTLTAAAECLGYTPAAVSQHLAALERTVGAPLVRKVGRALMLTDVGHGKHRRHPARADRPPDGR
jgi:DNA-binding transcriptional LysR family regulator